MSTPRMPARRGLLPLAAVADRERRDGGPERVIRRKHPVIPVPVLARRWHEIGEPVEKLKRREIDDAPGRVDFRPRPRPTQVAALCQPSMSAAAAASRSCVRLNQRIRRHEDAVGDAGMEMHVTVEGRACPARRCYSRGQVVGPPYGQPEAAASPDGVAGLLFRQRLAWIAVGDSKH